MLKIEDVKVGDELVCIDREFFNSKNTQHKKIKKFVISSIVGGGIHINGWNWIILKDELKHFKKKEQSQYTFDDLIDVAVKAYKNRLLDIFLMNDEVITVFNYDATGTKEGINRADTSKYYQFVDFINSLYKETFVIERKDDIKRVKSGANIVLSNSVSLTAHNVFCDYIIVTKEAHASYDIDVLKGATVTQSK